MNLQNLHEAPFALVFPGQGSQAVGMGKDLYDTSDIARSVFDQADQLLGASLTGICFDGPAETLEDTFNAQPALLTMSIAALADLHTRADAQGVTLAPVVTAGHSLGEFTALVAANAISFADALLLVRERGRLMKEVGSERPGGMAAVIGMDDDALVEVVEEAGSEGIIRVANANCPGQTVISGEIPALELAMELAKARGARRVARLGVSIASHSPLMEDASHQLVEHLDSVEFRDPHIPIVGNVSARSIASVEGIREELAHHMERPVNWTGSVREMIDMGASIFVELGPGNVLSGLIRRIDRDVATASLKDLLPQPGQR